MEVRIYQSMSHYTNGKPLFVSRVYCPDAFSFSDTVNVFRSIYGTGVIIVIFAL